jgi:hypothetical protein
MKNVKSFWLLVIFNSLIFFGCETEKGIVPETSTIDFDFRERYFIKESPSVFSTVYTSNKNPFTNEPFLFLNPLETHSSKSGKVASSCVSQTKIMSYDCSNRVYQIKYNMCFPDAIGFDWYLTKDNNIIQYLGSTSADNLT